MKVAKRGRTGRRREGGVRRSGNEVAPYIKRAMPIVEFLDEEGLVKIEEQADWLIKDIGLEFRDDPSALHVWREAGTDVRETRVRAAPAT